MSFLKHIGKTASSYKFDILIHEVTNIDKGDAKETFFCAIERGKKRFKVKDKTRSVTGTSVSWNEVLTFTSTLYKSSSKKLFQKKVFELRVKSTNAAAGKNKLSLFASVNLAAFASTGIARTTQSFPLQHRHKSQKMAVADQPHLRLTIACEWINDMEPDKSGYSSCSSKHSLHGPGPAAPGAGPGPGEDGLDGHPGLLGRPASLSIDPGAPERRRSRGNSADSKSHSASTPGGSVNAAGTATAAANAASPLSASSTLR